MNFLNVVLKTNGCILYTKITLKFQDGVKNLNEKNTQVDMFVKSDLLQHLLWLIIIFVLYCLLCVVDFTRYLPSCIIRIIKLLV